MAKRITLTDIRMINGKPFRKVVENDDGTPVLEKKRDTDGRDIMQIPRGSNGEPCVNCQPEPTYQIKTEILDKSNALPEQLKNLFLRIPKDKMTRQDTIYGTRMFQNISSIKDGILELDEDVHKWIRDKLQDKEIEKEGVITPGIGLSIFGVNLTIIEDAVDNFERLHEKAGVVKEEKEGDSKAHS